MKQCISICLFLFISNFIIAQNVAINATGTAPDASAILDITSTTKGLLIPRMTTVQRTGITSAAKGLIVYDNTTNSFWFYDGSTTWTELTTNNNVWSRNGNAGTIDGTHFIGTTDDVPLNFRVNNIAAGRIDKSKSNTFFGYQTGIASTGKYNTFFGNQAGAGNTSGLSNTAVGNLSLNANTIGMHNSSFGAGALYSNTVGSYNTAFGSRALNANNAGSNTAIGNDALSANITGYDNTAIGAYALWSNTDGGYNTAIGLQALFSNTADSNTAIGYNALQLNTTGLANTATGTSALFNNIAGDNNTANGYHALFDNTGGDNTAVGSNALSANTLGAGNTAVGSSALSKTDGTFNTAIGYNTNVSIDGLTNATAIGANTVVDASNKVRIGDVNVTIIEGQVGFTTPSDSRFKFNIKEDVKGLEFILKLRPVTYQFNTKKLDEFSRPEGAKFVSYNTTMESNFEKAASIRRTGLLAQEVEKATHETGYDFDGIHIPENDKDHYSLSYATLVTPLIKAVQQQQQIIETQKNTLDKQQSQLNAQDQKLLLLNQQLQELKELILNQKK